MRIVHVVESLDPSTGGPSVSVPSLAIAQSTLGHSVTVFHGSTSLSSPINGNVAVLPGVETVQFIPLLEAGIAERLLARNAFKRLRESALSAEVFHLHGVWRPVLMAAARAALSQGVDVVISPRGMLDPWSLKQHGWRKGLFFTFFWRGVLDKARFVHALNDAEAQLMIPLGLKSRVCVHPNGVFPELFRTLPSPDLFRSRFPELGSSRYILFCGRLHYKKGVDLLVDAFGILAGRMANVDLVIAGPDGGMRTEIEQRVSRAGLNDRVHLTGAVYGAEKLSAMAGAECFCLPSRQEGFSMAITEAMACGSPVVASDQCHFPEIEQSGAGYVVELKPEKIGEALFSLLSDTGLRKKFGAAARTLVLSRYDWRKIGAEMVSSYTG